MDLKVVALVVVLGMQVLVAKAEYREFTDAKGRTLSAKLIRYNDLQKKVTIKCKGKGIKTVPVSIFSETDQKYIASWKLNQDFLSEKKLLVEFKRRKRKNADSSYAQGSMDRKYYDCSFIIEVENRSTVDFNNVLFEYVIFYSQDKHIKRNTEKEEEHGTLYVEKTIDLPRKSPQEIETEKLLLYTYRESGYSEVWPDINSEVHGVILKLSMKSETGETISREIKYPDNLDHVWTPKTKDVQRRPK
ncbi:MAG: hypothetical protein ABFR47_00960 [Verrucomicrobiota bacterium]